MMKKERLCRVEDLITYPPICSCLNADYLGSSPEQFQISEDFHYLALHHLGSFQSSFHQRQNCEVHCLECQKASRPLIVLVKKYVSGNIWFLCLLQKFIGFSSLQVPYETCWETSVLWISHKPSWNHVPAFWLNQAEIWELCQLPSPTMMWYLVLLQDVVFNPFHFLRESSECFGPRRLRYILMTEHYLD